jgi:hypothetical protein
VEFQGLVEGGEGVEAIRTGRPNGQAEVDLGVGAKGSWHKNAKFATTISVSPSLFNFLVQISEGTVRNYPSDITDIKCERAAGAGF